MTDPNPDLPAVPASLLDLSARYPACFDPSNPRPLKRRIHKDLMAAGTPRIDLQGQPAGDVTEDDAANAQAMLSGAVPIPKIRPERPKAPPSAPAPVLPKNAPLRGYRVAQGNLPPTLPRNRT
jgi:hypothetical protein